jgi:hypothetical protein
MLQGGGLSMDLDDRIRSKNGVVICLRDMGDGTSRLFLDDVHADGERNPLGWSYEYFYTFSPALLNTDLDAMNLPADQFQQIGEAVVARLLAMNGRAR